MIRKKYIIIYLLSFYSINAYGQLQLIGGLTGLIKNTSININNKKFTKLHHDKLDSFVNDKLTVFFLLRNFGEPDHDIIFQYENINYRIIHYEKYKSFKVEPSCHITGNMDISPCLFNYYLIINDTVRYLGSNLNKFLPSDYFLESDIEKRIFIEKSKKHIFKRKIKYDYQDCNYEISLTDDLLNIYNKAPSFTTKISIKNIGTKRCDEWVRAVCIYKVIDGEEVFKNEYFRFILKDVEPQSTKSISSASHYLEFLRLEKW